MIGVIALVAASTLLGGGWEYSEEKDAMSDKTVARAFKQGVGGKLGIKCDAAGPESVYVHLITEKYLDGPSPERRALMLRFDGREAQTQTWTYKGHSAIAVGPQAQHFVGDAVNSKQVVMRAYTFDQNEAEVTFDLAGLRGAAQKVYKACADDGPFSLGPPLTVYPTPVQPVAPPRP